MRDTATLTATWSSAIVSAMGLVYILTLTNAITSVFSTNSLDKIIQLTGEKPVNSSRWLRSAKPPPEGPVLDACLDRLSGVDTIYMSERPIRAFGHTS